MKTYIITLCLIGGLGLSTQAQERYSETGTEVIEYIDESSISLTEKQEHLLKVIRARPQSKSVTIVKLINISSVKDNDSIEFNLPKGQLIHAQKEEVKIRSENNFTWNGRINDTISTVNINKREDNSYILLHSKDVRFEIEPLTKGLHALVEIDPTKFEDELPPLEVPEEERKRKEKQKSMMLTTPEIDVLVAYTTDAKNSTGDINQLISSAEGLSNVSFSNSDVNATINIVHTVEVSYTEADNISTDLTRLRLTSDGHMDNIHSLRNQHGADLVVLLVASGGAGIGYVDATSSYAFSVVHYSYAQSQYTMTHEIGHNLGCAHNTEDANVTAYSYGHGYRNSSAGWRTLMAYSPPSNRINFWSNPDVDLGGVPMGTVQDEDNARVWDERAATVAAFKSSLSPAPSVSITGPSTVDANEIESWSASASGGTPPYSYTWYKTYQSGSPFIVAYGSNYADSDDQSFTLTVEASYSGSQTGSNSKMVTVIGDCGGGTGICKQLSELEELPNEFALYNNYPNPFNPSTQIKYALPAAAEVSIKVYNIMGQQVAALVNTNISAGFHEVNFDAKSLSSGVYIARMEAVGESGQQFTKELKMQLIK